MEPKPAEIVMLAIPDLFIPDWNPRPFMDEAPLQELMAFMAKGGIVPRIWVWKGNGQLASSPSELAHPNQGLRPEASAQGPWAVIAGQRRLEASRRLGRTHVEVEILDISLEDAMFLAVASNRDNKPYWLGEFIAVENLMAGNKDLKQVDIIAKLGWSNKRVSYAVNLMKLLNPASRQLIWDSARPKVTTGNFLGGENQDKPGSKDKWRLPESVATRLIPLLNPLALEASQAQAEKALKMVVPRQLDRPQTDELVASALSGKDLGVFKPTQKVRKPRARKSQAQGAGSPSEPAQPNPSTGSGQAPSTEPVVSLSNHSGRTTSAQQPLAQPSSTTTPQDPHAGFKLVGHALGSAFHWAVHNPLPLLKSLAGYAKQAAVKTVNKSIQHYINRFERKWVRSAVILILIAAAVFIFIPGTASQRLAWFMNHVKLGTSRASAMMPPVGGAGSSSVPAQPNPSMNSGQAVSVPMTALQGIGAPNTIQSTSGFSNQATNQTPSQKLVTAHSTTPKKPETHLERNARAALVFGRHYFGANYENLNSWKNFFKQAIDDKNYDPFMDHHFPDDKIHEIEGKKLVMSFKPTQPVKLLGTDDRSDFFLVNGVMTTITNADGEPEVASKKTVAAQIIYNRQPGGGYKVGYLKDLTPEEVQKILDSLSDDSADAPKAKSSDSTKVDPLAKAVGDAAGEAAKKALNLPF